MGKNLSIRLKITLWFALAMLVIILATFFIVFGVSKQAINKALEDTLVNTVVFNLREVEYHNDITEANLLAADEYVLYGNGFLEIDEDFLNASNGTFTSLYDSEKNMIYGENPIAKQSFVVNLSDDTLQEIYVNKVKYFIYDKEIETGDQSLWLRGVVPETEGSSQLNTIATWSLIILPLLWLLAVVGGYVIARRAMKPIRKVTLAAREISSSGDLSKRIGLDEGKNEATELGYTFNRMMDRLEANFDEQRQFTSNASHELRTPTSVIMAQTEFTLEKDRSAEEYKKSLAVISRQGKKMAGLINDMLDVTRLEMKAENYSLAEEDLSNLVNQTLKDLKMVGERGIILQEDIEEGIMFECNRGLMVRLVTNLVSNAYRYGSQDGWIKVSIRKIGGEIFFTVKDNGTGISKEDLGKIFDRFYRADKARSTSGTGLGLSMVKQIVDFHGGQIQVESELGQGSEFIVRF